MAPMYIGTPLADVIPTKRTSKCSDPSVLPPDSAPNSVKDLWWLHGHPHSKWYSDPKLISLAALVRNCGRIYGHQPGFLFPVTAESQTSYKPLSWHEFDRITESLAALYAHELLWELQQANRTREQPTIALLGRGTTVEYFCTELALQKLGIRVLLLAESNSVTALHHLLGSCDVLAVITDRKNAGADIKHIRRISMIEELPHDVSVQQANVDAIRFQDFGDVWERHTFILHSSGSTGLPKPIIHTNRSLMLIARMYRLFPDFEIKNWFLLFPLYHVAGLSIALSGLPNGGILSFPPLSWPPSSSSLFTSWETLSRMGCPVDIVHCAPTLIENMYEYIMDSGKGFTALSSLKVLQPGGASLSAEIVNVLVANGVNVKTTYGSTEIGPPFRTIPHSRDNPKCYSFRSLYPDNDKLRMEKVGEGLYECVVYKGFELAADLWNKNDEPFHTNDLFIQDPPGSGFYVLQGRKDDILIHTNGENTSGGSLQEAIQASSKMIKRALALGHSRPCVSLLVELGDGISSIDKTNEQKIWEAVDEINERYPPHSQVLRSMIYILPNGVSLPVTPKGNVKRKEAEQTFADEIARLYNALEGSGQINSSRGSQQPLDDHIRGVFAEVAGVPVDSVKDWTTIYDLGIDSRLSLTLRSSLSKRLGPISLSAIFENPSPSKLLLFLKNKDKNKGSSIRKPDQSQLISHLLSKLTSEFQTWPVRTSHPGYKRPETETILLTGSTGTLGTSLLETLCSSPRVSKIYALIRGPNHKTRLRDALSSRGHDPDSVLGTGKIEILNYSMQDPLLGLNIEDYAKLASTVTIVLHNAWKMDFNLGVESFIDDCLRGTLSLLRLAHSGAPKTFSFTSSSAACTMTSLSTASLSPTTSLNPSSQGHNTGYALSKYLAESLLHSFSAHLHLPIRILRLGQLCGDSTTGSWNSNELWPILFKTGLELGALPVFESRSAFAEVDWLPVDVAAEVVRDVLLGEHEKHEHVQKVEGKDDGEEYREFNIVNPHPVAWGEVLKMLQRQLGHPITTTTLKETDMSMKEVSLAEWVHIINEAGDDGTSPDKIPALKLLPFFERMVNEEMEAWEGHPKSNWRADLDTTAARAFSPALEACSSLNEEWIERSVRWWRSSGFLS